MKTASDKPLQRFLEDTQYEKVKQNSLKNSYGAAFVKLVSYNAIAARIS